MIEGSFDLDWKNLGKDEKTMKKTIALLLAMMLAISVIPIVEIVKLFQRKLGK